MTSGSDRPETLIVTSAHWVGDARLNRHLRFLGEAGHPCRLISTSDKPRVLAMASAMRIIATSPAAIVILPDPELFLLGSLGARLSGKKAVIDIHENYAKTAAERPWIPGWARPIVAAIASLAVALGRQVAWRVLVAAPELARRGDYLVSHAQDPSEYQPISGPPSPRLVYIGEVSPARGAFEMVELLSLLDPKFELLIVGRARSETEAGIEELAKRLGVSDRVHLMGRLTHEEAWLAASDALAGLNLLRPAPAYREAVATKIFEYMAAGLPPVVSDLPGQAAVVSVVHPDLVCSTTKEAASIVTQIWQAPELREEMVARGRELVSTRWREDRPDLALQRAVSP